MIFSARAQGPTYCEGFGEGRITNLQLAVSHIDDEWPGFEPPPGDIGESGGVITINVAQATPLGSNEWQGVGVLQLTYDGPSGPVIVFNDPNAQFRFSLDAVEELGLEVDGISPAGKLFLTGIDGWGVESGLPYVLRDLNPGEDMLEGGPGVAYKSAPVIELLRSTLKAGRGRKELREAIVAGA